MMHTRIIRLFLLFSCFLPGLALAATTQTIRVEWGYPNQPASPAVTGFKLYQEGEDGAVCTTMDARATAMDCSVSLIPGTTNFTLTATLDDGTESPRSAPFAFTTTRQLSFSWEYDQTAELKGFHIYQNSTLLCQTNDPSVRQLTCAADLVATPARYTLTAVNVDNIETSFSNAITYTDNTSTDTDTGYTSADPGAAGTTDSNPVASVPPLSPPKAVISSSAAVGPAPLAIHFDGSGSTATNATITSCAWRFGDGASATGATASHTYLSAGTYSVTLTVTDSKGQSNSVTTPVIITAPVAANKPPQAVISATATAGPAPLTLTFNGGGSNDSDGRIVSYVWNFGDGSGTVTGQSVTHTYTTAGTFTATLQVTDDQRAVGNASLTIVANSEQRAGGLAIEAGEIAVSSEWVRVSLTTPFTNPIVVAGPPSFNNAEPCTVRIRNVTKTGFEVKLTEWDYLDGVHPQETISYLVMEQGRHTLPDGAAVEAGSFTGATSFKTMNFKSAFATIPVVLTTVTTMNDAKTVTGRLKNISISRFMYQYQEQERNTNRHHDETVHYIAWEPGSGMIGTLRYAVARTTNSVTNAWYSEKYKSAFSQEPLLVAGMLTTNDASPAALRVRNQTTTGFQVKAEAEMSKNSKTKHSAETVGYIALDQPSEKK